MEKSLTQRIPSGTRNVTHAKEGRKAGMEGQKREKGRDGGRSEGGREGGRKEGSKEVEVTKGEGTKGAKKLDEL